MRGVLCHNSVLLLCFADSQKVVLPLLPPAFASLPLELEKNITAYKLRTQEIQNNLNNLCTGGGNRLTSWFIIQQVFYV